VRIFEYAGLMMHAKTMVADGWWGRVGSTNLNPTGLVTNWEVDVCVEDPRFGAAMETMYEDDLAHAREIRLADRTQWSGARPERPESPAEQRARREAPGHHLRAKAALGRAGTAVLRAAGGTARRTARADPLRRNERLAVRALGATALAAGLVAARYPRLLAWPLAAVSAGGGVIALLHSLRAGPAAEQQPAVPGPARPADGTR
jgi:cardiolipin synthase A/B